MKRCPVTNQFATSSVSNNTSMNAALSQIEEMLARRLLALPYQMKDITIHPNVPLFIFDSMAQVILGIFYPDSPTSMNIEPNAFMQ
jgi:hypothetical protein